MASIGDWIQATRPKTLGAALAPVIIGAVLAWELDHVFSLRLLVFTLGSCVALQIATNLFNDAIDFIKGADTVRRLGPRRITASGSSSAQGTLVAAWVTLLAAVILAAPLIEARGWIIIVIGIPSLFLTYGYTGGPMPLAYRGLGELFVILFFGLVAVMGSAFVQSGQWYEAAVIAGFQVGCLSTVLIAVNNLRDIDEDRASGKRTLAVRFGPAFAQWEIALLILGTYGVGFYWWIQGFHRAFTFPLILLPVGFWIVIKIFTTPPGPAYNRLLAFGGLQLLLFTLLFCLGLSHSDS